MSIAVTLAASPEPGAGRGANKHALSKSQVRMAQAARGNTETHVGELCKELKITRSTLYRYVGPDGELRERGKQVLTAS